MHITYIALLGSVSLGAALAFGLGGRDAAARSRSQASDKGRDKDQRQKLNEQAGP